MAMKMAAFELLPAAADSPGSCQRNLRPDDYSDHGDICNQ